MVDAVMHTRTQQELEAPPAVPLREAADVMSPERLGALQPTRLSASRSLMSKMVRERWAITRAEFALDERARGTARYHVDAGGGRSFEFVLFSFEPQLAERTDRIIGRNWDMMGALLEGSAGTEEIEQTKRELPKLYGGRAAPGTLVWCRANRSMRAFDFAVDALAAGRQPAIEVLGAVCYLMRNTGLDGNGTFGTRSFGAYEDDHPLRAPYHAQMLTAYLMREFSLDLAEHLAACRNPGAARLDPALRRFLGLGNASGLGLVLFAKNHPQMLDRWLAQRERALADARSQTLAADSGRLDRLDALLERTQRHREQDRMRYTYVPEGRRVSDQLQRLRARLFELRAAETVDLDELFRFAADTVEAEAQEILAALLIELFPEHDEGLAIVAEAPRTEPGMSVGALVALIEDEYGWALEVDLAEEGARHYAWYKSANAEEPRRGALAELPARFDDMTLDLTADLQRLFDVLRGFDEDATVGSVLRAHPGERYLVERIQTLRGRRYHTVQVNMRDRDFIPSHVIRLFNSALYGLDKTKEDGAVGVVGVLFHGAPTPAEIARGEGADWPFPSEPELS